MYLVDIRLIYDDGASIISEGWPDQPVTNLFKSCFETFSDLVAVEFVRLYFKPL